MAGYGGVPFTRALHVADKKNKEKEASVVIIIIIIITLTITVIQHLYSTLKSADTEALVASG